MNLEDLLERAEGVRRSGDGWSARCPAHEDRHNSLGIGESDGKLLLHCFAGCEVEDICKALGLQLRDLFDGPERSVLTVEDLAFAKRLPDELLRSLGVHPLGDGGIGIPYRTADGSVACMRRRTALVAKEGSSWVVPGKPTVYGLDRLAEARAHGFVVLVEGESDCWTLWHHGFPALGIPGCSLAGKLEAGHVEGIPHIFVIREPDKGGAELVEGVASRLAALGFKGATYWVQLDGAKDPNDLHRRNPEAFKEAFQRALEGASRFGIMPPTTGSRTRSKLGATQSTLLVQLAQTGELFHTPDEDFYATHAIDGHDVTRLVRSGDFRIWLAHAFFERYRQVPHSGAIGESLQVIQGLAQRGPEHQVHTRAGAEGNAWYLFLADERRRGIEITHAGWRVVDHPAARFRKSRAMRALPEPARGGNLADLRGLLNLGSDEDWLLVRAWLLAAICPVGTYPVLGLHGEQGSAKSTVAHLLRTLVDPNGGPLRAEPASLRDLMIAATNCRVIALDNLTHLPIWLSNALCRMSTGGAIATRELYTDADEVLIEARRPVILNGIEELAGETDLLERTIVLHLPFIEPKRRRTEKEVWRDFEQLHARLLGALLDVLVVARQNLERTRPIELPRMADFARLVTAAEPALGVEPGAFLRAYGANEAVKNTLAFECSPIATALLHQARRGPWHGTSADLLFEIGERVSDAVRKSRGWPTTPRAMSAQVRRMMPAFRTCGVDVTFERAPGGMRQRLIRFEPRVAFEDRTLPLPMDVCEPASAPTEPSERERREEVLV